MRKAAKVKKATGKPAPVGKKTRGQRLDVRKAVRALGRGATAAQAARAAGSTAAEGANLRAVGSRLLRRIRDVGRLQERADALGIGVEDLLRKLAEKLQATKTVRIVCDKEIHEYEDIDHGTQLAAVGQAANILGLNRLKVETGTTADAVLGAISDELLFEELVQGDASGQGSGVRGQGVRG